MIVYTIYIWIVYDCIALGWAQLISGKNLGKTKTS